MKTAFALAVAGTLLIGGGLLLPPAQPPAAAGDPSLVAQLLEAAPATVEPQPAAPAPDVATDVPASGDTAEADSRGPRFTVAGKGDLPRERQVVPTSVRLGDEPAAPVVEAGVEANGEMEVPDNVTDVAWYGFGPSPGESGSAVLAAHVDLAGQGPGVFYGLADLPIGSVIEIGFSDGSTRVFQTFARARYDKDKLPIDLIFSREGSPVLTLVTCGGGFNPSLRRYDSNVVVFAFPFADTTPVGNLA